MTTTEQPRPPYRDRCRNYVPDGLSLPPPWEFEMGQGERRRLYPASWGPADELNRGIHGRWDWLKVSDPEEAEHWSHFEGHGVQVDVELTTYNVRVTNDWKGRDEVRAAGTWRLLLDRVLVATADFRDPLEALLTIRRTAQRMITLGQNLIHGPGVGMPGSWRYAHQALLGRRVYYNHDPAMIERLLLDEGRAFLKPDGVERFACPPWWTGDDWDEYADGLFVGLSDRAIWWHRDG